VHAATTPARSVLQLILLLLSACASPPDGSSREETPNLGLTEAVDQDGRADIVAVTLRASASRLEVAPGISSVFNVYSQSLPGPLIRAQRGDTLRVHFENALDEPTSVHWHGVRVPNAMDGVPEVTQPLVAPHATFDYVFQLPDAGLFWYHPHYDSVNGLGSGLYGALLVRDPAEPDDIGDEVVLVLSDANLDDSGTSQASDVATILAGREGATLLVNGRVYPTLRATQGRRQRWRVLNAARSRYFKLGLSGHSFLQIGSDGGLSESAIEVQEPLIVPGERLDLVLTPTGEPGTSIDLLSVTHSRGLPLAASSAQALLRVDFVAGPTSNSTTLPELSTNARAIDAAGASLVNIALTASAENGEVRMGINDVPFGESDALRAKVLQTQVWVVENKTPYSHPFHLHGFFFQPLDDSDQPLHPITQKDTLELPPLSTRRLAVSYDDRPGMWMFHCHILDHAEAGMMGMVHVAP
jgi:FtsP/CotA-like multicopper oxidase with cupredoxin domain